MAEYTLIRSRRRTVSLEMTREGLIVRAPWSMPKPDIDRMVEKHSRWIDAHRIPPVPRLTEAEREELRRRAETVFPQRVAEYAPRIGVSVGKITVRFQKTRWGSCSQSGNLSFNALLLLAPPEVLDSVVVHELCHRKHMNHSAAFYREVERAYPEYAEARQWLKRHGSALLARR